MYVFIHIIRHHTWNVAQRLAGHHPKKIYQPQGTCYLAVFFFKYVCMYVCVPVCMCCAFIQCITQPPIQLMLL